MKSFKVKDKLVEIFSNDNYKKPVVIVNTFENEGESIWNECKKLNCKDFVLVAISNVNWNDEMTPWVCEPIFKGTGKNKGLADKYLKFLEEEIIPKIKSEINIEYFAIAGYSLGGLFALYSVFKTDLFKSIVTASGSMWYPNFEEFVKNNELNKNVQKIYFSLGNKEKNSKNEILKTVEDKTVEIQKFLSEKLETTFVENEGNHFQDASLRTALGIKWILE